MIPIIVDPETVRMALIGRGEVACSRLAWLEDGGGRAIEVFSDAASPDLSRAAGNRLRAHLPTEDELSAFQIIWIADLPLDLAIPLAEHVRARGALVNVEDVRAGCDFHNPALVRRGDLMLTVSTNGKSPGLAARIKRELGATFGPEWADRLGRISRKRQAWKVRARPLAELASLTDEVIDANGWLHQAAPGGRT